MRIRGYQTLEYDVHRRLNKLTDANHNVITFGYGDNGQRLWKANNGVVTGVWIGDHYEEKSGKTLYHVMAAGRRICTFEPAAAGTSGYNPATQEFYS